MEAIICPFCDQKTALINGYPSCLVCGDYNIGMNEYTALSHNNYTESEKLKISIFLRQLNIDKFRIRVIQPHDKLETYIQWGKFDDTKIIEEKTIDEIIEAPTLSINDRLNNTLINLSKLSVYTGAPISITYSQDYPVFYPERQTNEAIKFTLKQLILDEYIEFVRGSSINDILSTQISITPKGWNKVAELESRNKNSKKVFVAMWFSDEMLQIFDKHIKPTVDTLGREYDTFHIAQREHNNDITDEIIAGIKTSKFVIADLTGDRGGVYYEAGFARGLGIPVILTCREDWFKKTSSIKVNHSKDNNKEYPSTTIHFDVAHLNIIVWNTPEELAERLKNRILATID